MFEKHLGLMGASSFVGESLITLLLRNDWKITAFSRRPIKRTVDGVVWHQLHEAQGIGQAATEIPYWISVAPIWIVPDHFELLEAHGVRRLVVLSSTSRYTKVDSSDPAEQDNVRRFVEAEQLISRWAESKGVQWVILRPTLIYGLGRDGNIFEIARFIHRFGFFPLFGRANGLRQPVHVDDVAAACLSALLAPDATNRDYNISGGETLNYRQMVARVFDALGRKPRMLTVPLFFFRLGVACLHLLPRYRHWTAAMAERMNRDLVFDHSDATRDFGFNPRPFSLSPEDLPD